MSMDVVGVDGRTDKEKFHELLALGGERTQVDFKETVDLSNKHDELEFVKDAVAMLNYYPGGYIVIGVDDDGKPSARSDENDWRQFDSATLTDKIKRYIDAPFEVVTGKVEDGDYTCFLVCLKSPKEGYPIPFKKNGCDSDNKLIIREGEILRRNGAKNDKISYSQWGDILEQHDKLIREDESKRVNDLIERFTASFAERGKTPPLAVDMAEDSLDLALRACFEAGEHKKLVHFARQLSSALPLGMASTRTLAALGSYAVHYDDFEVYEAVVDGLYDYNNELRRFTDEDYNEKIGIATAIYVIGSATVRSGEFGYIGTLVGREYRAGANYVLSSWVRDCQIAVSERERADGQKHGMVISIAFKDLREHPILRPDLPGECNKDGDRIAAGTYELLLNSLCGFDLLYCIYVYATAENDGSFFAHCPAYPSFVGFNSERTEPVVRSVFGNRANNLHALLPGVSDQRIADGLSEFYGLLASEMRKEAWTWIEPTGLIQQFMKEHRDSN